AAAAARAPGGPGLPKPVHRGDARPGGAGRRPAAGDGPRQVPRGPAVRVGGGVTEASAEKWDGTASGGACPRRARPDGGGQAPPLAVPSLSPRWPLSEQERVP